MKKYYIIILFIIFYSNKIKSQDSNTNNFEYNKILQIGAMYGGIFDQFIINPNYCVIRKKQMYSIGLYYRNTDFEYLINLKTVPANAKFYGLKLGYINNAKLQKKFSFRMEYDLLINIIESKFEYNNELFLSPSVLSYILCFGPNINFRVIRNIDISLLLQIGVGYGTLLTPIVIHKIR